MSAWTPPPKATSGPPRLRPPRGLGAAGRALWRSIVDEYTLEPHERVLLAEACRTADELERLRAEAASADLIVQGSTGQPRPNPLFGEVRRHSESLARLLRALRTTGES